MMHPTPDELRDFVRGNMDEPQALSINSHLDACPACDETIRGLETSEQKTSDDELMQLLRTSPVDDPYEQEPACQELVALAQAIPRDPPVQPETAVAAPVPAAPAAELGNIGQYELVEKLGEGGMGAVYKARHTRLKRMVAIKVLPPDRMDNAEAVARFQREMEAVGRLQHPNIVAAHDAGEADGTHFLVMEYVNGLTLSTLAQQPENLGVANACELVRQAACGLEHAHQHGLVHRDIKPSNLILARDGTVKVLDLGLARLWGGDVVEDELTSTGQIMGTADYIAPDQALDPHGADIRADIYSLGCTLYHLLAGRPPFRGPGFVNVIQKVMAHAHTPVPPLQDTRKDLPAGLIDVINRMLAKSPADRYATPAALIAALEPYCAGASLTGLVAPLQEPAAAPGQGSTHATASRDVGAMCETHITTSAQEAPAEPASTILAATPPRRGSGRRLAAIAGGAAALVLLLGVILLKTGSGELELHVNEPDVQVSIDGALQKIELKSPRDQVTITVPAGKHTLRVGKDGFEADVQEFRIVRNGKVELSATLKPLSAATSDPARQTDPVPVPVETPAAKAGWQGWPADAPPPAIAPFNAEQAQQHQEAWARYLRVPVEYSNSIGMKFRLIPPGEFTMGSSATKIAAEIERTQGSPLPENIRSEGPDRRVRLARPFFLGMHEVTQGQFAAVMGTTPSAHSPQGSRKRLVAGRKVENHPVESVNCDEAAAFCEKLSRDFSRNSSPAQDATVDPATEVLYRLPYEAEWEFACRGGTETRFWCGDDDEDLSGAGWFGNNSAGRTHAVGELAANPFGIFDVHGNVWEWTLANSKKAADAFTIADVDAQINRAALPGTIRALRGGDCWPMTTSFCRSASRLPVAADFRSENTGFRVIASVDTVRQALKVTGPAMAKGEATTPAAPASGTVGWHGWPADAPPPAIAPFNAEQAQQHQEAWAKHLGVPVEYTNSIGMKFRLIPPGEFMMGSTPEEIDEYTVSAKAENAAWLEAIHGHGPQHKVFLTKPIYLGATEVTQTQYEQVMGNNPSQFSSSGENQDEVVNLDTSNHPVEMVSWVDATRFCTRLSAQEQLKPFYHQAGVIVMDLQGDGYRLPTEAEWEFANRAGTVSRYWCGGRIDDLRASGWFNVNANKRTHAVGELPCNAFGLFDTAGNVWEWVRDAYDVKYYSGLSPTGAIDPCNTSTVTTNRIHRGGSWHGSEHFCRSADRGGSSVVTAINYIGFRVVLTVEAVKKLSQRQLEHRLTENTGWHGWPTDAPKPAIAPFNAQQAQQHQEAWGKYLRVPVEYKNSIGMKFRLIPPGEFLRGSTPEEINEALEKGGNAELIGNSTPRHRTILTRPFYLSACEVTQRDYARALEKAPPSDLTAEHPIVDVSWDDAVAWCATLSKREDFTAAVQQGSETQVELSESGYRLPTEAEWEFACRAGTTTKFWTGDDIESVLSAGWFSENSEGRAHRVGELAANPFQLYDIHGNVWEQCHDGFEPSDYARFEHEPAVNPQGSNSSLQRIMRGGRFNNGALSGRAAYRFPRSPNPTSQFHDIGFRPVLSVAAVRKTL